MEALGVGEALRGLGLGWRKRTQGDCTRRSGVCQLTVATSFIHINVSQRV